MTREEFLSQIRTLSGIETPTDEQETIIKGLVYAFEERTSPERVTELEGQVSQLTADLAAEKEKYNNAFWSGETMKPPKGKKIVDKPTAYDITVEDVFNYGGKRK